MLSHCVKSVQIRSFSWSVSYCIRTEYGDLRSLLHTFHAVSGILLLNTPSIEINIDLKWVNVIFSMVKATQEYQQKQPSEVFYKKKDVLENFAKFTEQRLFQSLFFNKAATLLKKRLWHRCFPVNFAEFLRTLF